MSSPSAPPPLRTSSARRSRPATGSTAWAALAAGVVLAGLIVLRLIRPPAGEIIVPPTPTPTTTPTPIPIATQTPGLVQDASGWVQAVPVLPPSPTPTTPPMPSIAPTRTARSTPIVSSCVVHRWSTIQVFSPSPQVKVDIRVDNRCPYDLDPNDLWFEITGWRNGERVRTVRGHPFETIRRGRSGDLAIGLPGSLDWYDRIDVVVLD